MSLIDDLKVVTELMEGATSGPWESLWTGRSGSGDVKPENRHYSIYGLSPEIPMFMRAGPTGVARMNHIDASANSTNAALICAAVNFLRTHATELQGLAKKAERYDFLRDPDKAAEVGVYGCVGAAWLDQTIDDAIEIERETALSAAKERGT